MKIAIAQIAPCLGDLARNFDLHHQFIAKARKNRADLIVFPELSLTGYTLMDMVPEVALKPAQSGLFRRLLSLSREINIVFGFVEEKNPGLFYNSAAYLSRGQLLNLHRKVFLPTFGMFEEAKFFAQGRNFGTFASPFGRAGLLICRDFLSWGAGYLLMAGGAEIIIVISAAPGRGMTEEEDFATSRMWELMGEALSFFSTSFVVYANRVGFEDGKAFAGGSFIYNPAGKLIARASSLDEELLVADLDLEEVRQARKLWPFQRDDRPELVLNSLARIVRQDED
ncbi:MAG: nitrilase-related carbon-nitrogen hydrolase [Candidatus Aminicenantales bacterium]